jgi:multicomponent Na+:H+ antiporter subunit F
VNEWLMGAAGLLVLLLPAGLLTLRGDLTARVLAMQLGSTIATLALLLLAEAFRRNVYSDMAVVAAAVSFVGTLFYLRALESWL